MEKEIRSRYHGGVVEVTGKCKIDGYSFTSIEGGFGEGKKIYVS